MVFGLATTTMVKLYSLASIFYVCFFLIICLFPTVSPADLNSDATALLSLRTALKGYALPWDNTVSPCTWPYVKCASNRVIELYLPGLSLTGSIPTGTLGNLSALTFLSLQFNSLTGSLPSDLRYCAQLRYLNLQKNLISGDIPSVLFGLSNLTELVLAGNNLTGEIPVAFSNLTKLVTLSLGDNQLTGSIPDLNLPSLRQFNISNNLMEGTIPNKLAGFPSSSFKGNSLCGHPLRACPGKKLSVGAIFGMVIAGAVDIFAIALSIILLGPWGKKNINTVGVDAAHVMQSETEATSEANVAGRNTLTSIGDAPLDYNLLDLLSAPVRVLGKGTYGTTFKVTLAPSSILAIKRLRNVTITMTEQVFEDMVQQIGRMKHENLLPLRAYHYFSDKDKSLLVFDYLPEGSLSAPLHGLKDNKAKLNWETRLKIALGAARGVTYIHSLSPSSSHGNIKSSNILLTNSLEARVSDYGLTQLASQNSPMNGYRELEVTDPRFITQNDDVYSFGVLLLELVTGKTALLNDGRLNLPRFVRSVEKEEWASRIVDEGLNDDKCEEMIKLLQLGVDCCNYYPNDRPSMAEVSSHIELISSKTSEKRATG